MINPHVFSRFGPKTQTWLKTQEGQDFFWKFLNVKGQHCLIRGRPGSGKTRKMLWLASFLAKMETIVWIDSCKDEEISPLFNMGLPINLIIPSNCKVQIQGLPPCSICQAYIPDLFWTQVLPGHINIMAIHNYFMSDKERAKFYTGLFKGLAYRALDSEYFRDQLKIKRMAIFGDEAQRVIPSLSYTRDSDRLDSAQAVTTNILEVRATGIRMVLATQSDRMVYPSARDQMPTSILCQGAQVKSDESRLLHSLCGFAERYATNEGLIVYSDGKYSWKLFPNYPKVKGARIRYTGKFDQVPDDEEQLDPDLGVYRAAALDPGPREAPGPSRSQVPLQEDS